jgi:hypothetical protein
MAFNFNWSPLTADAEFYSRARDLLTKALNKSPKPPIIVDDILVDELNLGNVPPDLEILEIGDLAEDRFRGIFKMTYSGDAYLTLKTRVQVCLFSFNRSRFSRPFSLSPFHQSALPTRSPFALELPRSCLRPDPGNARLTSPYPRALFRNDIHPHTMSIASWPWNRPVSGISSPACLCLDALVGSFGHLCMRPMPLAP